MLMFVGENHWVEFVLLNESKTLGIELQVVFVQTSGCSLARPVNEPEVSGLYRWPLVADIGISYFDRRGYFSVVTFDCEQL